MVKIKYLNLTIFVITLLLSSTISQSQAENTWSDDFNDGDLDDWKIFCFDVDPDTFVYTYVNETRIINSGNSLEFNSSGVDNPLGSFIYHSSNIAYGIWEYDLEIKNTWDSFILSMSGSEADLNMSGLTESQITHTGYALQTMHTSGILPASGIALWKLTGSGLVEIGRKLMPSVASGTHHYEVTRAIDGTFDIFIDNNKELTVTDNTFNSSDFSGIVSFDGNSIYDNITVTEDLNITPDTSTNTTTPTTGPVSTEEETPFPGLSIFAAMFIIISVRRIKKRR